MTRILVLLFLVSVLAPPVVEARPDGRKLARQAAKHKKAGLSLLERGQLDRAIDQLQIAYGLSNESVLLFHLGEAHNLKKEYTEALYYYRSYLAEDPEGAARRGVEDLIEALAELEEGMREPAEPEEPPLVPVLEPEPAAEPPTEGEASAEALKLDRRAAAPGRGLRVTGAVTIAAGVALGGTSGYFAMQARTRAGEISDLFAQGATWDPALDAKYDEGRAAQRNARLFAGAGGVAVLSGAVLYYFGHRRGRVVRFEAGPISGGGAVAWSCAF
jgi:tetratricopeptide (TPR) repeat protein